MGRLNSISILFSLQRQGMAEGRRSTVIHILFVHLNEYIILSITIQKLTSRIKIKMDLKYDNLYQNRLTSDFKMELESNSQYQQNIFMNWQSHSPSDWQSESNSLLEIDIPLKTNKSNETYPSNSPCPLENTTHGSTCAERDDLAEQIIRTNVEWLAKGVEEYLMCGDGRKQKEGVIISNRKENRFLKQRGKSIFENYNETNKFKHRSIQTSIKNMVIQHEELTDFLLQINHRFNSEIAQQLFDVIERVLTQKIEQFNTITAFELDFIPKLGRLYGEDEETYHSQWYSLEVDDETLSSFARKNITQISKSFITEQNFGLKYEEKLEKITSLLIFISEVVFFSLSSTCISARHFRHFKEQLHFEYFQESSPAKKVKLQ